MNNETESFEQWWLTQTTYTKSKLEKAEALRVWLYACKAELEKGAAEPVAWLAGVPSKPWADEWFIALTTFGDKVVLRSLPEDYGYDFKTADDTYIKADKIKCWMQFPDSEYTRSNLPPAEQEELEKMRKEKIVNAVALGEAIRDNAQLRAENNRLQLLRQTEIRVTDSLGADLTLERQIAEGDRTQALEWKAELEKSRNLVEFQEALLAGESVRINSAEAEIERLRADRAAVIDCLLQEQEWRKQYTQKNN